MVRISAEQFEELAEHVFDGLPEDMLCALENVVILIEEDSPAGGPVLLGEYDGVPTVERDSYYGGYLPDRIRLFRNPLTAICADEDELRQQIRITLIHEIGHHLGLDEHRLHELGYG